MKHVSVRDVPYQHQPSACANLRPRSYGQRREKGSTVSLPGPAVAPGFRPFLYRKYGKLPKLSAALQMFVHGEGMAAILQCRCPCGSPEGRLGRRELRHAAWRATTPCRSHDDGSAAAQVTAPERPRLCDSRV